MHASFLAVGSELLGEDRVDTNSLTIARLLARYGVELRRKAVVGDVVEEIARQIAAMLERSRLVVVSGGLGPTADDVTRQAAAAAVRRGMRLDPAVVADIEAKFARFGRPMAAVNRRQAMVIEGAEVLDNRRGTAPGLRLDHRGSTLFLLPGVPREIDGLIERHLEPWLERNVGGQSLETRTLKVAAIGESDLEQMIAPAYAEFGREAITVLASPSDVRLRLTARGDEAARAARLGAMQRRLAELVGKALYAFDDVELEAVVGRMLEAAGETVATAESCTGGLLAERLTRTAGSSAYFEGALVVYSNRLKSALAGVPEELVERHGAVSEEVARALAEGARERLATTWAIGVTGVAGPGGGSEAKPVGTVHVAIAGPAGTHHRLLRLAGDRERIRWQTSQLALEMLRRRLLERCAPS